MLENVTSNSIHCSGKIAKFCFRIRDKIGYLEKVIKAFVPFGGFEVYNEVVI